MCKVCEFANLACDSLGPSQPIVFLFSSLFSTGVAATSTTIISHSFLLFQIVFVTVLASTSTSMSFTNHRQLLISKVLCISLFLSSISKDLQMTKIFKSSNFWMILGITFRFFFFFFFRFWKSHIPIYVGSPISFYCINLFWVFYTQSQTTPIDRKDLWSTI